VPSAPEPRRNSLGDIIGAWEVHAAYSPTLDRISLTLIRPDSQHLRGSALTNSYDVDHVETALSDIATSIRTWHARRLF
jgi:hypothetical protein